MLSDAALAFLKDQVTSGDPTIRSRAAKNSQLPEDLQEVLSKDHVENVRCVLAMNPSTSPTIQHALSEDSVDVRNWLASNPALPLALQEKLLTDPEEVIRGNLAKNTALKPELQPILSMDNSPWVTANLARNSVLVLTPALNAFFVYLFHKDYYSTVTRGYDQEALTGLLENWNGTLEGLLEASTLVSR